jgi:hypothetical protein
MSLRECARYRDRGGGDFADPAAKPELATA